MNWWHCVFDVCYESRTRIWTPTQTIAYVRHHDDNSCVEKNKTRKKRMFIPAFVELYI